MQRWKDIKYGQTTLLSFFFFFWLHRMICRILVPRPGIEAMPSAVKALGPWTAREFLTFFFFLIFIYLFMVASGLSCSMWDLFFFFFFNIYLFLGLPWWHSGWESACQCRGHGFGPWPGKIPHAAEQLGPCATTAEPEL